MADDNLRTAVSPTEADNSASNPFYHVLSDGTNPLSVTGGVLDVNATVTIETAYVDDSAFGIASDKVNAQGFLADETATDSVDEGDIGIARMTLDRIMITAAEQRGTWTVDLGATDNAVLDAIAASLVDIETNTDFGAVVGGGAEATALRVTIANDSTGLLSIDDGGGSITVDGTVTVTATQLDIDDLNATDDNVAISDGTDTLAVNADGSINVVFGVASSGTEVHDHDKSPATAKDATDNHDYTVTGTTFLLSKVSVAGAGRIKAEIQTGPVASLVSKIVLFKERETTVDHEFVPALPVPVTSTGTVRIIRTQRSLGSLFMYSTIEGEDI
jgi:hypothetical protein